MRRLAFTLLFVLLTIGIALAGHYVVIYQGGNVTEVINPGSSGTHTLKTGGANIALDPGTGSVNLASKVNFTGTLVWPLKADPASPANGEVWVNGASIKITDNATTPVTRELFTLETSQIVTGSPKEFRTGALANAFRVCSTDGTRCIRRYCDGTQCVDDVSPVQDAITRVSVGRRFAVQNSASTDLISLPESGGLSIGTATPTPITNIRVFSPSLTPVATAAAIQTVEQTFTVTGLATTDKVFVNGPVPTSLCPPVTYRVSAVDTLAIGFTTLTVAVCTPAAGTYTIVAIRS